MRRTLATEDALAAALRAACSALEAVARPALNSAAADHWAAWLERAAIREYGGGLSRHEAERLTAAELGPCPPEPAAW